MLNLLAAVLGILFIVVSFLTLVLWWAYPAVFLVLMTLKLVGVITISWLVVFSPVLIFFGLLVVWGVLCIGVQALSE